MKQELAWGTAAAMAIVAAVGISTQSGKAPASAGGRSGEQVVAASGSARSSNRSVREQGVEPQCSDLVSLLGHFFLNQKITGPANCYTAPVTPSPLGSEFQTNFVIATVPDPLHTHLSLLFDRFAEAIQQGAMDEGYEYDSSWLPWDTDEPSLALLKDQDDADERKSKRENQPGILVFRGTKPDASPYSRALIVFIVGEESTRGIHRAQFQNAVAWIQALQQPGDKRASVAILGPAFSGSFPSLTDLLAKTSGMDKLNGGAGFSIYSGSASGRAAGEAFAKASGVEFRSFVRDDSTALDLVCRYFGGSPATPLERVAILSEDETAYGSIVARKSFALPGAEKQASTKKADQDRAAPVISVRSEVCQGATNIYYPRDISTLRAAYQTQSMFSSAQAQLNQDAQRKSLPTDLADTGKQMHDTVRTYAGNQTPLSQEAELLGIVDVLRAHRAQYVILRSSNTLDPLFLANFLRRDYPEARVVIMNSDLLFQRGQDAMALSGVMTLSTYPLFSWAREWTALPPYDVHSHRVFPENNTEGAYIASRMLLQALRRPADGPAPLNCKLADKDLPSDQQEIFAPPVQCQVSEEGAQNVSAGNGDTGSHHASYAPLPDYAPPFWTGAGACGASPATECRPAVWLSVITRNGTWPLAALNDDSLSNAVPKVTLPLAKLDAGRRWPGTPRSTKLWLVALCGFAVFHFLCCWYASYTAKPAFRAHFATAGPRHTVLVLIGSYLIALMTLLMGWGCGIFSTVDGPPFARPAVWAAVVFVWLASGSAVVANIVATRRLSRQAGSGPGGAFPMAVPIIVFAALTGAFFLCWVWPINGVLLLANRAFVYWRSMNLTSGVSPIVPFLSLSAGLYVWFWYALHGLALFGIDSPRLPGRANLLVKLPSSNAQDRLQYLPLSMFSQEDAAAPVERVAKPLAWDYVIAMIILFAVTEILLFGFTHGVPIRSLGATRATPYTSIFCIGLGLYCSLILCEAWQVWRTWSGARQLLVFLDRLALRRTLSALRGFSWGSVWKMSGNVLDVRYKLLSRQLECLTHLHNSLRLFQPTTAEEKEAFAGIPACQTSVNQGRAAGMKFAKWYSKYYRDPRASDLSDFKDFQEQIAETTGVVLSELLLPASRLEERSLIQLDPDDKRKEEHNDPPPSKIELIRNAEELVCLTYLGYAQNLLGRVRTIVLGGVCLFIALTVAVSSYPFDPRTLLSGILLFLFVILGGTVIFVYADMHRDATLSHVTQTTPGELGTEFWFKVVGYGAAPLLGLMTQVFPEWTGILFSWLQPGLSSLK